MPAKDQRLDYIIWAFVLLKLLIHLFTSTNYGFHRDEFLYLDQGNHLGWGYMEVPPMIAFLSVLAKGLGGSLFAVRLLPALIGALSIYIIGRMAKEMGGGLWAIVFACLAFLLSPAFLRSNALFQPVSFNQFFWLLSAYYLFKLIHTNNTRYWYAIGITAGFGFLTKYSIVFYFIGLILAFLLSPHRKFFLTRHPYIALGIALLIAAPNLYWQYVHHFPVLHHMEDLHRTQLVNVELSAYFLDQLFFFLAGAIVWGAGLLGLLFDKHYKNYRFLGVASLITILLIALLDGKSYYTVGAYSVLLVFGGLVLEKRIKRLGFRIGLTVYFMVSIVPFLPLSLPILPNQQMVKYCDFIIEKFGLDAPMRWEDGVVRELPQDYADMNGWEEMVERLSKVYHQIEDKEATFILGGSYGHAGAINYYRKKSSKIPLNWLKNDTFFIEKLLIIFFEHVLLRINRYQS